MINHQTVHYSVVLNHCLIHLMILVTYSAVEKVLLVEHISVSVPTVLALFQLSWQFSSMFSLRSSYKSNKYNSLYVCVYKWTPIQGASVMWRTRVNIWTKLRFSRVNTPPFFFFIFFSFTWVLFVYSTEIWYPPCLFVQ